MKITLGELRDVISEAVSLNEMPKRAPAPSDGDWQLVKSGERVKIQERMAQAGADRDTTATVDLYVPGPNATRDIVKSLGYVAVVTPGPGSNNNTYISNSGKVAETLKKHFGFRNRLSGVAWSYKDLGSPIGNAMDRYRSEGVWIIPFNKK